VQDCGGQLPDGVAAGHTEVLPLPRKGSDLKRLLVIDGGYIMQRSSAESTPSIVRSPVELAGLQLCDLRILGQVDRRVRPEKQRCPCRLPPALPEPRFLLSALLRLVDGDQQVGQLLLTESTTRTLRQLSPVGFPITDITRTRWHRTPGSVPTVAASPACALHTSSATGDQHPALAWLARTWTENPSPCPLTIKRVGSGSGWNRLALDEASSRGVALAAMVGYRNSRR
jgi:hypothetical protein